MGQSQPVLSGSTRTGGEKLRSRSAEKRWKLKETCIRQLQFQTDAEKRRRADSAWKASRYAEPRFRWVGVECTRDFLSLRAAISLCGSIYILLSELASQRCCRDQYFYPWSGDVQWAVCHRVLRLSPTGDSKRFSTLYTEKIPFCICSSSVL
jgi:hypothetical protein